MTRPTHNCLPSPRRKSSTRESLKIASMAEKLLIIFFLFLFKLSCTFAAMRTPISAAIDVLSDSGYFSMAITLQLTSTALNLASSPNLTVFAPSETAFFESGQPSLLDLQYQVSPARLSGETFRSLPYGAKIPTLRSNASLIVTNASGSGGKASINYVLIQDSAIFDDGYVVIYGTDEFFGPFPQISLSPISSPETSSLNSPSASVPSPNPSSLNSSITGPPTASSPNVAVRPGLEFPVASSPHSLADSGPNLANGSSSFLPDNSFPRSPAHSSPIMPSTLSGFDKDVNIFEQPSGLLMSRGFITMGTFLDLQLENSANQTRLTVFAPVDEAFKESTTNFSNYSMIFRGHVVPRLLSWKDLRELGERSILPSALRGFELEISWSGDILLVNGVPVIFPDMYVSDWVAVHGLNQMILPQSKQDPMGESFSELDGGEEDDRQYSLEFGEYDYH